MLKVLFARSCWTVAILYLSCLFITPASTQTFSYLDKQYFLVKERKTLDDAAAICLNRGQRLVQIRSKEENDFIQNSIVKSADTHTWIGATNTVGTKSFMWLDGSAMIYSNWYFSEPNDNINQHNGIFMYPSNTDGKWEDYSASDTNHFICETLPIFALHSKLVKQTDELNATIGQLDSQLNFILANGTSTLRSEYIELIGEVKQSNDLARDGIISKLDQLFELNAINALAVVEVESSIQSVNESHLQLADHIDTKLQAATNDLSSDFNAKLVSTEEKLVELIKGQVVEYAYMDKQYVLTRVYNTFYSAVRICQNRNETLININSRMENEFVFNTIVKPSGHMTWLGATNEIGSNTYKWLDATELIYSNWDTGFPGKDADGRNGILMNTSSGQWFDELATGNGFVLCERPTVFALQSTVIELQSILLEQAATIRRLEQNREQSQMDVIRLERQASNMTIELAVQKRQNAELETRLTRQDANANDAKIELESRLARLERKLIKN